MTRFNNASFITKNNNNCEDENNMCGETIEMESAFNNNNSHIITSSTRRKRFQTRVRRRVPTIKANAKQQHVQKTFMLMLVCLLLFVAELPQALLMFISVLNRKFYYTIYKPLGDLLDILVLLTYSINFIVYCLMSNIFRKEFRQVFTCKRKFF